MPLSSSWFTMAHEIKLLWASSRKTELHDYSNNNIYHDSHRHLWVPSCQWKHSCVATVAAREADMSIVILDINSLLLGLGIWISYFPLCFTVPCQPTSQAGLQHLDPVDYFLLGYGAWGMYDHLSSPYLCSHLTRLTRIKSIKSFPGSFPYFSLQNCGLTHCLL